MIKNGKGTINCGVIVMALLIFILFLIFVIFYQQKIIIAKNKPSNSEDLLKKSQTTLSRDKTFCYKGEYFNGSCMEVVDINNDGKEEIVYEPKSASWINGTYILKEKMEEGGFFELFCKHCVFDSYASSIKLVDINRDNLVDVIVPVDVDQDGRMRFRVYYFENNDFVLKESYDLPASHNDKDKRIKELLEDIFRRSMITEPRF